MSSENVELALGAYDAFNQRDLSAFLALMDADVRAVPLVAAIEGDFLGHDGMRRWWNSLFDVFPDFTLEVVEIRELGDAILARLLIRGHGTGSDTPFDRTLWHAIQSRDQKVVWWGSYATEAEALEAIGRRQ